ncbi:hypothetical protein [Saccharomonospora saliphila]|uniref:hypothetical protein n=1 Tax=Saccharomonospora saliphila TaxID=369829 RepID=UPI00037E397D|nr:hypothetical protein [Saccharomonospora saliphila]
MAEPISDRQVVRALRPFVRATAPLVDALREAEPFAAGAGESNSTGDGEVASSVRARLVTGLRSVRVPGTPAWSRMDAADRTDWWVNRVGRFTALLTAVPGLGGVLADRLPVQDTIGVATQGLLLCAVAGEHGVTDVGERVRLVAWVLFERDLDPELAAGRDAGHDAAAEDRRTEELTEDLAAARRAGERRVGLKPGARTVWRLGRSLLAITGELEKRPSGRVHHQALGALPVVGMVGNYFGERAALRTVAEGARTWLARRDRGA